MSANWRRGQGVSEPQPVIRHLIDLGGLDVRITRISQLEIGNLVGHDIDDIGQTILSLEEGK